MNERDRKVLGNILTHIDHIFRYTSTYTTLDQFAADERTVEASVFNMMQSFVIPSGSTVLLHG